MVATLLGSTRRAFICAVVSVMALSVVPPSGAASLLIGDEYPYGGALRFYIEGFTTFTVEGVTYNVPMGGLLQPFTLSFPEGDFFDANAIEFSAVWPDAGQTSNTGAVTVEFGCDASGPVGHSPCQDPWALPGAGDQRTRAVLHYTYSTGGGFGHLDGFVAAAHLDFFGVPALRQLLATGGGGLDGDQFVWDDLPLDFSKAYDFSDNDTITAKFGTRAVPEPLAMGLLGFGLLTVGVRLRRRTK